MSEDEQALTSWRNKELASLITVMVGLAAHQHPDAIKAALGQVFDLSAVETSSQQLMLRLDDIYKEAQDLRALVHMLREQIDQLEHQASGLEAYLEMRHP